MDSKTIALNAISTAMLLPVVILAATIVISFLESFISLRKANEIMKYGLVIGVIAFAVATFFVAINVFAMN